MIQTSICRGKYRFANDAASTVLAWSGRADVKKVSSICECDSSRVSICGGASTMWVRRRINDVG